MRNPVSRFAYTQSDLQMRRSLFERSHDHKTTMSAGLLYPLLVDEVLPGDTYSVDIASLVRMSTPIHPVMDNAYLDLYCFFVPNRIVWEHWKEFMGESPEDPYINPIEYSVPMLVKAESDTSVIAPKSLLDYLGIPSFTSPEEISALPVRAFCKIWNEWFRDQNLQNAIDIPLSDENLVYSDLLISGGNATPGDFWDNNNSTDSDSYVINAAHGGDLPPVNKYHDYFTSALKEPQKGDPVAIPLNGFAPVYANNAFGINAPIGDSLTFSDSNGHVLSGEASFKQGVLSSDDNPNPSGVVGAHPVNLIADMGLLADAGIYATISDLRYAFQLQKFLEADSRGGTRYREILKQHFNVTSPDASQQIPEFLGGKRIPINISQVLQTSATDTVSPQGNTAAYSLTTDKHSSFTKSFTEHGFIFCVGCIRTEHTYSQGIERMFFRKNKFDYYFPEFANISEQPIYNKELYLPVGDEFDPEVANGIFGYQEAWAEYRFKPNRVSGEFRPTYPQSLDIWHYGDDYSSQPYLSSEWIRETRANIDRTLAVSSDVSDQFICDFYFKMNTTRVMPIYSIPGLADHH